MQSDMSRSQCYSPLRKPPMSPCRLIDEILSDSDNENEELSSINKGVLSEEERVRKKPEEVKISCNKSLDNVSRKNNLSKVPDGHIPEFILNASFGQISRGRKQTKFPVNSRKQNKEDTNKKRGIKNKRDKFDILTYLLPKL